MANNPEPKQLLAALIIALVVTLGQLILMSLFASIFLSAGLLFILAASAGLFLLKHFDLGSAQPKTSNTDLPLQEQLQRYNQAGAKINTSASKLAINSAELAYFLADLSSSIKSCSQDAGRISSAANEMSQATEKVAQYAITAAEQSAQAKQVSDAGAEQIHGCSPTVRALDQGVNQANESITRLAEYGAQIQDITEVINSIASQTNLLALNAAIEAARAGEQGRGFAVVADEVRALAGRTAKAIAEIDAMLKVINEESQKSTTLMTDIARQSHDVVESIDQLALTFEQINSTVSDSSAAAEQINQALAGQDTQAAELSSGISNIGAFLQSEAQTTTQVSSQADSLSAGAEAIFVYLEHFNTDTLIDTMSRQAQSAAKTIGETFERAILDGQISQADLFDFNYQVIDGTNPQKYHSGFDTFTDRILPDIQEPLLEQFEAMIYAGAVDIHGYFPTHNKKFSQPLSGDYDVDINTNRTKRIFDDPTGKRCGSHRQSFLLQTYKRDTGEIMHDVSAPIMVSGKHWGGFRIGFKAQD